MTQAVLKQLQDARQALISTDTRNPLVHFRCPAKSLQVLPDALPSFVTALIQQNRQFAFLPAQEPVPTSPSKVDWLRTNLTDAKLISTLTKLYREASTLMTEQGMHALYLGVGFLEWYESPDSDKKRYAPLFLIPVTLERKNVSSGYRLVYSGDDVAGNEPLALRLRQDFGIGLPTLKADEPDLEAYLADVTQAIAGQKRWVVHQHAHLGFFSFSRYLMARDLEQEAWPDGEALAGHRVVQALLGNEGFPRREAGIGDGEMLDRHIKPSQAIHVADADSSQALAIHEVSAGRDLLIQGPPGTGKSQTITNIIADAVAQGRTVLFVAEKMAALEVVQRRLTQLGLGQLVLELHGHQMRRKAFVEQLKAAKVARDASKPDAVDQGAAALDASVQTLNAYVEQLHAPLEAYGISPYRAFGEWAALGEVQAPTLELAAVSTWNLLEFESREETAERLQEWVAQHGRPQQHVFWGTKTRTLMPMELQQARASLEAAVTSLQDVIRLRDTVQAALNVELGSSVSEVARGARGLLHAATAPDLYSVALSAALWEEHGARIQEGLGRGRRQAEIHGRHDEVLTAEAWTTPVAGWRRDLSELEGKWWRVLVGRYRTARAGSLRLYREVRQADDQELLALLRELEQEADDRRVIEALSSVLAGVFGTRWQGVLTNFSAVDSVTSWMIGVVNAIREGTLPSWTPELAARAKDVAAQQSGARELTEKLAVAQQHVDAAARQLGFENGAAAWLNGPLPAALHAVEHRLSQLHTFGEMTTFNRYVDQAEASGLASLVALTNSWEGAATSLVTALRQKWLDTVIRVARHERPALASFDPAQHEAEIAKFRRLDQAHLRDTQRRVLQNHWLRSTSEGAPAEWRVLNHQFNLKMRYKAIRVLMEEAGSAIQALKPVFMMSPLSVANHLPRGKMTFDLVIFDEASQIRPEEGIGAIARGRQVVVVGDEKQLPPSSFFLGQESDGDGEDGPADGNVADLESLLGAFSSAGARQRMLRWHYRSRHQSLIAVSNSEFYDNQLVLFPSCDAVPGKTGLIYHHLPNAFYDFGKSRTNREEARTVAQAVMRHAHETPELSLGVAAFSAAQADAILDEVENLRRQDPSAEASFFDTNKAEPFFVKNLENVQGDERDVIFISVGYGRQESGKLSLNFGPLNKSGGERRMNVLISRAKLRCEVFTNLRADDIDLGSTGAAGMRVLKTFLQYAATGNLDVAQETGAEADSPFEEAVERALRARGYDVRRQVGSGGYRVDLAIVDPKQPGRYLLGIECDGATYHRSRSARDRDRLRQQVLENLGWSIHRIWSTDWFMDPQKCIREAVKAIERAS